MKRIGLIVLFSLIALSLIAQLVWGGYYFVVAISCALGVLVLGPTLQSDPNREAHLTEDLPPQIRGWYPHPTAVELESLTWLRDHHVSVQEMQQWSGAGLPPALIRSAILTPSGEHLPAEEARRVLDAFSSATNLSPEDPDSVIGCFRHLDLFEDDSAAYGHTLARWAAIPSDMITEEIAGIDVRNRPAHDDLAGALESAERRVGVSYSKAEYERTVEIEV